MLDASAARPVRGVRCSTTSTPGHHKVATPSASIAPATTVASTIAPVGGVATSAAPAMLATARRVVDAPRMEHRQPRIAPLCAPALSMAGVHKSFYAGVAGCSATARVLVGASLCVEPGEVVGIAGGAGAGKTTLLLCAAGLLRPELGGISWFGERDGRTALASGALLYFPARSSFPRRDVERALSDGALLLLVEHAAPASLLELRGAIGRAIEQSGAAVVIASRDRAALARVASRILIIRDGCLHHAAYHGVAPHHGVAPRPVSQRKRSAARASSESPLALARASIRSTCGRSFRSPQ